MKKYYTLIALYTFVFCVSHTTRRKRAICHWLFPSVVCEQRDGIRKLMVDSPFSFPRLATPPVLRSLINYSAGQFRVIAGSKRRGLVRQGNVLKQDTLFSSL